MIEYIGGKQSLASILMATILVLSGPIALALPTDSGGMWLQTQKIHPASFDVGSNFGSSLALAGETLVVGAPGEALVSVHTPADLGWELDTELSPSGPGVGFGHALALADDGGRVAVGAPGASTVYVYERVGATWTEEAALSVPGTECLGRAVAMASGLIVAGAPCEANAVHVFERSSAGWSHVAVLEADVDRFGWSLAASGGTLAIGSLDGSAHLYQSTPDGWAPEASFTSPIGPDARDGFGHAVGLQDGDLIIGAPKGDAAYIYNRDPATGWGSPERLVPGEMAVLSSPGGVDFGRSVALSGDLAIVGAPESHSLPSVPGIGPGPEGDPACLSVPMQVTCQYPGAVYIFHRSEDGWSQMAKVHRSDASPSEPPRSVAWFGRPDSFGDAVSMDGGLLAVGAPMDDVRPWDEVGSVHLFTEVLGEVAR